MSQVTSNVPSKPWDERTQENQEHTKMFPPKMFLHICHTLHSKHRWILVKCCTQEILCTHRLWKICGKTLVISISQITSNQYPSSSTIFCNVSGFSHGSFSLQGTCPTYSLKNLVLPCPSGWDYYSAWWEAFFYNLQWESFASQVDPCQQAKKELT